MASLVSSFLRILPSEAEERSCSKARKAGREGYRKDDKRFACIDCKTQRREEQQNESKPLAGWRGAITQEEALRDEAGDKRVFLLSSSDCRHIDTLRKEENAPITLQEIPSIRIDSIFFEAEDVCADERVKGRQKRVRRSPTT